MFLNCIFLAISSSIDSLGIGITYGVRNIKISVFSKFILFFVSLLISVVSIFLGNFLFDFLPTNFTDILGSSLLCFIGTFTIIKGLFDALSSDNNYYDFNHSNLIDPKEALFLALALSLDSFGIGVSSSLIGSSLFFPICVSIFQLVFLNFGTCLGKKINKISSVPNFVWSLISGILLIVIGLLRL